MKKLIALSITVVTTLLITSFSTTNETIENNRKAVTDKQIKEVSENERTNSDNVSNSDIWNYMHENVFGNLDELVSYNKERMFSRCPSGFGQHMDNELSDNHMIFGKLVFRQGCEQQDFCFYKLNWDKKKTFLKKEEKDEFVALDTFVKNEKKKIAKI